MRSVICGVSDLLLLTVCALAACWPGVAAAAGNVTASVVNGKLAVVGDAAGNHLLVTSDFNEEDDELVRIVGEDGTTVNGGASFVAVGVTGNASFKLAGGEDELLIGETEDFPSSLDIDMGTGNDLVDLTDTRADQTLNVRLGDGDDELTTSVAIAEKKLSVSAGEGDDTCTFFDLLAAGGRITVATQDGTDTRELRAGRGRRAGVREDGRRRRHGERARPRRVPRHVPRAFRPAARRGRRPLRALGDVRGAGAVGRRERRRHVGGPGEHLPDGGGGEGDRAAALSRDERCAAFCRHHADLPQQRDAGTSRDDGRHPRRHRGARGRRMKSG